MPLDLLRECTLTGPAFPEPFVRFEFEKELTKADLLPKGTGEEGRLLQDGWEAYRRKLRELAVRGGAIRVRNHVLEPLVSRLGYARLEPAEDVHTREGEEAGGYLLTTDDGAAKLRAWCTDLEEDLEAPARRGAAYRYSHVRSAQRVLLTSGERLGLLTNGVELRLLISDPARPDSQIIMPIDPVWKRSRDIPDSYRFLLALASPAGVQAIPALVEKARLQQTRVTTELRRQARQAIELFIQEVLDHSDNREALASDVDMPVLAKELWHEGLITVYRLLFILKLEASDDPERSFSFASTSLWRNTFSPSVALAPYVRAVLDHGAETGYLLEGGLRTLFRMFAEGLQCTELNVQPLGGALFGTDATPRLSRLKWGEHAVAYVLDRLLWTPKLRGSEARERVHYGPLDVEDLGRVYEALLELEPGIATEPMCRLRRQKLEVVVPIAQGEKYRPTSLEDLASIGDIEETEDSDDTINEGDDAAVGRGRKTNIEWTEAIPPGRFYLRVGLGRKATGSYYTPHSFVRFLVQETLGPLVAEYSPEEDPRPGEILKLKVLDPAMGSGHFLVEACRFLGEKLYEACRLCDERALAAESPAVQTHMDAEQEAALTEADEYRWRVQSLPDPDDELMRYLPSRAPEGEESGLSQKKAEALCRRLVVIHCLYGVDKNPLAVELAKLSLWIESHAEGLPLTFLDHRLVLGDSLTGPFFKHLLKYPGTQQPMEDLFTQGLRESFANAVTNALKHIRDLEATVGVDLAEIEAKHAAKARLDRILSPFKIVAAGWAGGIMLSREVCDDTAYAELVRCIANIGDFSDDLFNQPRLLSMIARGFGASKTLPGRSGLLELVASKDCVSPLPFELVFPEVFYPREEFYNRKGFDAVLGNPPWERLEIDPIEYFGQIDFRVMEEEDREKRKQIITQLATNEELSISWEAICEQTYQDLRIATILYSHQTVEVEGRSTVGRPDTYRLFVERFLQLARDNGLVSWVVPSSYHSNEGATGIRRLYLTTSSIKFCYSFENRRKLFDIDSRQKYCLLLAKKSNVGTKRFRAAFYLHNPEWLFSDNRAQRELAFDNEVLRLTGGDHEIYVETKTQPDLDLLATQFRMKEKDWAKFLDDFGIVTAFGVELHRNSKFNRRLDRPEKTSTLFIRASAEQWTWFPIHAGKTIFQYTDQWDASCSHYVLAEDACGTRHWKNSVPYYRLAFRRIAASTNERTMIAAILTPGFVCEQTLAVETSPGYRATFKALLIVALSNSYSFDWQVRRRVTTGLSNYILSPIPIPNLRLIQQMLCHITLRLTCSHIGYERLWYEQLGSTWREARPICTWPVLEDDDECWEVRAAIDAVIADAYRFPQEQYAYMLSSFNHRSYPRAPELCLAMFDELKAIGLEAFTKKYDPYWDIPLNEDLPQPVIDLPIPDQLGTEVEPLPFAAEAQPEYHRAQISTLPMEIQAEITPSEEPPDLTIRRRRRSGSQPPLADDTYELVKLLLKEKSIISSADVQELTGLDSVTVRPFLKRLVEEGCAAQVGHGRNTRYGYIARNP